MPETRQVQIGNVTLGNDRPFALIAGPCQIESRDHALDMAGALKEMTDEVGIGLIYKSSYDKANRTSLAGQRGIGLEEGIEILAAVREAVSCPVLTDVHEPRHCAGVAEKVDVLQIPAFLCRQTDLLLAAGQSGLAVNVKKGQFLSPGEVRRVVEKVVSTGNHRLLITERGTSFGYNNLVVDMRALPIMQTLGYPVVFDATHSVQLPGGAGVASGGQREYIPHLARAAVAAGCNAIFMEVHPAPDQAPSDGATMWPLGELDSLLRKLLRVAAAVREGDS